MIIPMTLPPSIPNVPFYSQFVDIAYPTWQKRSCGIASLAMIIEYYKPGSVSVNMLLSEATSTGAYLPGKGWIHKNLVALASSYGLGGKAYDFSASKTNYAFEQFRKHLKNGPVIASVHYKFDPKSTIPHLVVINGIEGSTVYYNDPAAGSGELHTSVAQFIKGWKKRFIVITPPTELASAKISTVL